jgi:5'(3')-deoxyribonucleotidase
MTVYLDMDGVIADFFGGLEDLCGVNHWKSIQDKQKLFAELAYTDFFYTLPKFDTTDRLMDFVRGITDGDWGICSSPLQGDHNNSAYWKRKWLEKHYFMPTIDQLIFTSNKHKYAWSPVDSRPNILIDDRPANIKRWQDAGGIGILYQANENDFDEELIPELEQALRIR